MKKWITTIVYCSFLCCLGHAQTTTLLEETFATSFGSFTLDEQKYEGCTYSHLWNIAQDYSCAKITVNQAGTSKGACDCKLISPTLNATGYDKLTLRFEHTTYAGNSTSDVDYLLVKVTTDGTSWQTLTIPTWPTKRWGFVTCEIDLTPHASSSLQFMFEYIATDTYAGTWEIRKVVVEGETINTENTSCPYEALEGLTSADLRTKLHEDISQHEILSYTAIRGDHAQVDFRDNGMLWDIYSDYEFYLSDYCGYGEVASEGDCYNREHMMPKSWWGGSETEPMYTDLHHVVSTDAVSNEKRSAWIYDEVTQATWSNNLGSQLGSSTTWSGETAFEPVDEYKGDVARVYFYMLTCYMDKNFTAGGKGYRYFTYSNGICNFNASALALMLKWHREDPVSERELTRNEKVEQLQGNPNPFVEQPSLVEYIWGTMKNQAFDCDAEISAPDPGTVDGAITCQEAREKALALTSGSQSSEEYVVVGYVTTIKSAYNTQFKDQNFWIADTPNGGNVFYAYQCYYDKAVQKGDKVSITGKLLNYNSTPEMKWGQTTLLIPAAMEEATPESLKLSDQDVTIYSITGHNMSAMRQHLPQGIYILRRGQQACKVIIE